MKNLTSNENKIIYWAIAIVVILGAIFYWHTVRLNTLRNVAKTNTVPASTYNDLLASNNQFSQAEATLNAIPVGTADYQIAASARKMYEEALKTATSTDQMALISYKIARAAEKSRDYTAAISMYKGIIQNQQYQPIVRSYAATHLAGVYYEFHDAKIKTLTFQDEPFASMYVATSTSLSYRHLFEYASSLYPIGLSESTLASLYAGDVVRLYAASSSPSAQIVNVKMNLINQKFVSIDMDMIRMKADPNATFDIPETLQWEGLAKSQLSQLGKWPALDTEDTFKSAITMSAQQLGRPMTGSVLYYAEFLANMYGNKRATDIQADLAYIYNGGYTKDDDIAIYLRNEESNYFNRKASFVKLATIDPKFKAYLISLGWKTSDFQ